MIVRLRDQSAKETTDILKALYKNRPRKLVLAVYQHKRDPKLSAFVVLHEEYLNGRIAQKSREMVDAYMKKLRFTHFKDVSNKHEKPHLRLVAGS